MQADHPIRIAALSACLALVRPVGMTEDETIEWLEVASDTLADIPAHILERGARSARSKCTHHSQIVPMIVAETRDAVQWHNRPAPTPFLRLVGPAEPVEEAKRPLPDPETIDLALRRMGIARGWIIQREDGRLEWSEEDAA